MRNEKKAFLILLIIFSWSLPIISATLFKIIGYFEFWYGFIFFLLSFLTFSLEFKIGKGRIGLEPLSLLPIAYIFKSPIAVALSAFFGSFFGSLIIRKKKKTLLFKIAASSSFIFPYSLCSLLAYKFKISIFYFIFYSLGLTFLLYFLLFIINFILNKRKFDVGFFIAPLGWLVLFFSLSPLIYLEIVLYGSYGILGFFFPLLPVGAIVLALKKSAEQIIEMEEKKRQKTLFSLVKSLIDGNFQRNISSFSFNEIFNNLENIIDLNSACLIFWEPVLEKEREKIEIFFYGKVEIEKEELERGIKKLQLATKIPSFETIEIFKKNYPLNESSPYSLILPIKTNELYLGLIYISSASDEIIKEKTKDYLNLVSDSIGLSFQNNILLKRMEDAKEKLEKDSEVLSNLLNISQEITLKSDVQSVLQRIVESLQKILNVKWVLISTYSRENKVFCPKAQYGFEKIWERIKDEKLLEEDIFYLWENSEIISKSYVISANNYILEKYGKNLNLPFYHPLTTIYIPLKIQNELLGFLQIEGFKFNGDVKEIISLLELFANQASYSLNILNTYEKLHNLSIKDTLTDAYNFRYFKEILEKEIKKYNRLKNNFSIAIIDLDNFKEINDIYGHLAGDEVLQEIIKIIYSQIRKDVDMVFRYGGDEFALFFPFISSDKLKFLLERIRKNISEQTFKVVKDENLYEFKITVTIGGASFPEHSQDIINLIGNADKALLQAKAKGKNTVEVFKN